MSKSFSTKEAALITEANAKAKAKGADKELQTARAKLDTRPSKGPENTPRSAVTPAPLARLQAKVTKVPSHAAANATEKAPHTKRALIQNAEAAKLAKAEERVAAALAAANAAEATAKKAKGAAREAAFQAKAAADLEFLAAKKALGLLKRELESPEDRAARAAKAAPKAKAAPTPRADKAYKVVNKNHGAKPDSKRAKQLEIVFAHKSTEAAKAKGAESVDFAFAIAKGFIQYV